MQAEGNVLKMYLHSFASRDLLILQVKCQLNYDETTNEFLSECLRD